MRQTKNCAHTTSTCKAQTRKVKPFCHLTRKGTAPGKKTSNTSVRSHRDGTVLVKNNVISQERDCSKSNRLLCHLTRKGPLLKNKLLCHLTRKGLLLKQIKTPAKMSQQITKYGWISGTLSQHVAWPLRLEILIAGGLCISPSVVKQCLKRDILTYFLLPWRLDPFCTVGDNPRQARSCSFGGFCP